MSFETLLAQHLKSEKTTLEYPDFFVSAVKAASLSGRETRMKITKDIAEALNCDVQSLMFLFEDKVSFNDNEAHTAMPCFRQSIILEAAE